MGTNLPLLAQLGVTNDIRDIKPPVEIPSDLSWLWMLLAGVALAAMGYAVWRYWHKRVGAKPAPPPEPAHLRAKRKLMEALALIDQPEPFVVAVSGAVRVYLEERFDLHAPERTTEEFLHELADSPVLSERQKQTLADFLMRSDLVKFARYEPGKPELRDMHAAAVRLVDETAPTSAETVLSQSGHSSTESGSAQDSHKQAGGPAGSDAKIPARGATLQWQPAGPSSP